MIRSHRVHERFGSRAMLLAAVAACLAVPAATRADTLTYTGTGGLITGSIGVNSFTNATYSLSMTGDPTSVVSGTYSFSGTQIPYRFIAGNPVISITDGGTTYTATVTSDPGNTFGLITLDYADLAPVSVIGWTNRPNDGSTELASGLIGLIDNGPAFFSTLQSPATYSGQQDAVAPDFSWATSIGALSITEMDGSGTITIAAPPASVPEIDAASAWSALSLVMGALALVERGRGRRRQATSG
jgi:hypothetical protein